MNSCPTGNNRSLVKEISGRGCGNGTSQVKPASKTLKPKPKVVRSVREKSKRDLRNTGL